MGVIILAGSLLLQVLAGVLALRLVWVTRRAAWLFLASAIFLMSIRRTMTLTSALAGEQAIDSSAELVGLTVSILMVIGIAFIAPFFREIVRAGEKVKDSERRLQAILDNSESVVYVKDLAGRYVLRQQALRRGLWPQPGSRPRQVGFRLHAEGGGGAMPSDGP